MYFQIQLLLILANDNQLWRHDTTTKPPQLVNNKNKAQFSVDPIWEVPTGTGTIMIDQSKDKVFGLEDDDVTTKPNVVEEDLKVGDAGQTWTVTEVKTTETTETNKFYKFSIRNYFLSGVKQLTVQGT